LSCGEQEVRFQPFLTCAHNEINGELYPENNPHNCGREVWQGAGGHLDVLTKNKVLYHVDIRSPTSQMATQLTASPNKPRYKRSVLVMALLLMTAGVNCSGCKWLLLDGLRVYFPIIHGTSEGWLKGAFLQLSC
jgi:hypothetical protein